MVLCGMWGYGWIQVKLGTVWWYFLCAFNDEKPWLYAKLPGCLVLGMRLSVVEYAGDSTS